MTGASKALELIARADKYLNTGSGEYASDIMRDMAEFIRRSPHPGKPDREEVARAISRPTNKTGPVTLSDQIEAVMKLISREAPAQEPAAWGRIIDGKAITISRERTAANDEPLYAVPASHGAMREALLKVRNWLDVQFNEPFKNDEIAKNIGILNDIIAAPIRADRAASAEDSEEDESPEWLLACRLAGAELNYRNAYQTRGPSHSETGRCWDKMRKAGDTIREHKPNGLTPPHRTESEK